MGLFICLNDALHLTLFSQQHLRKEVPMTYYPYGRKSARYNLPSWFNPRMAKRNLKTKTSNKMPVVSEAKTRYGIRKK